MKAASSSFGHGELAAHSLTLLTALPTIPLGTRSEFKVTLPPRGRTSLNRVTSKEGPSPRAEAPLDLSEAEELEAKRERGAIKHPKRSVKPLAKNRRSRREQP